MQLSDIQTLCSTWLDDVNNGYFTLPQLTVWINNAQRETQKELLQTGELWFAQAWQTLTIKDQSDYIVPLDFVKLHRLELITSGVFPNEQKTRLERITLNEQDLEPAGDGTPEAYNLRGSRLTLFPAPDTANLVLRLFYSPIVTDLSNSTDVPNIPVMFQEYLAVLATKDGLIRDGRDPMAMNEKIAYYQALMKQNAIDRSQDGPRQVVITQSDVFGRLF